MKKNIIILISVVTCFATGYISRFFQIESIASWYPLLNKPALTPPNIVFPIVWGILYLLMGVSIGLIVASKLKEKIHFVEIFALQLILNFTWSILFFYLKNPMLGLIDILLLLVIIFYYIRHTYLVAKTSSILFMPYALWVSFAAYLNLYILIYN